ncbi:hypothetical protein [Parabacteroides distasonis]|uniref:hypothetical protein n=1 Tax=Parabacteroides distasonis TaxID=823 RepID=UPI001F56B07E|nr:hypothetical protein [Parabacteroides distasonis]
MQRVRTRTPHFYSNMPYSVRNNYLLALGIYRRYHHHLMPYVTQMRNNTTPKVQLSPEGIVGK